MPSASHEHGLPFGCPTRGFADRLYECCRISMGRRGFVPDAYVFDVDEKYLTLFECVVTHELNESKLWKLRTLRDLLASLGWSLVVKVGQGHFFAIDLETGQFDDEAWDYECRRAIGRLDRSNCRSPML